MTTAIPFSTLSKATQRQAVRHLRRDIEGRLGQSVASLAWWHQAVLVADPVLEWSASQGTVLVRRGQALLDRLARYYLLAPPPAAGPADQVDEELLALLP